jgi:hypothetical protein
LPVGAILDADLRERGHRQRIRDAEHDRHDCDDTTGSLALTSRSTGSVWTDSGSG